MAAAAPAPTAASGGVGSVGESAVPSATATGADAAPTQLISADSAPPVIVFSSSSCKHCKAALALLRSEDIPHLDVPIGAFPEDRAQLFEHTKHPTVPQIFLGASFLGGADSLKELHAGGGLQDAITSPSSLPEWLVSLVNRVQRAVAKGLAAGWSQTVASGLDTTLTALAAAPLPRKTAALAAALEAAGGTGASAASGGLFVRFAPCPSTASPNPPLHTLPPPPFAQGMGSAPAAATNASLVAASHTSKELRAALEAGLCVSSADGKELLREAAWSGVAAPLAGVGTLRTSSNAPWLLMTALPGVLSGTDGADVSAALSDSWGLNWAAAAVLPAPSTPPLPASSTHSQGADAEETETYAKRIADIYCAASKAVMAALLSPEQGGFAYGRAKGHPAWELYCRAAALLTRCNPLHLSANDRLALFLNVYNGLTIHAIVEKGQATTNTERMQFFSTSSYRIGGFTLSLDDIEHGVLRCNRPHPYKLTAQFDKGDGRRTVAFESLDPRVHFAMVCGAKACPPVRVYTGASVQQELSEAARAFVSDASNVRPDATKKELHVSRIFYWFRKDFGGSDSGVWEFIRSNAAGAAAAALALPESTGGWFSSSKAGTGGWTIKYNDYDWSLNGTPAA